MCGGWASNGICSPVSPGRGYYDTVGTCGDPETGVGSEECLCWVSSWTEPYTFEPYPFDANPEPFDANP